jgi:hypothetical protein
MAPFERTLLVTDRRRSSFSTLVILLAGAATTAHSSDHLATGYNRHAPNARKSLAAKDGSHIAPESRGRLSELRHVLGRAPKRRRGNSFATGSFRSKKSSAIAASGQDQATRIIDNSSRHWGS